MYITQKRCSLRFFTPIKLKYLTLFNHFISSLPGERYKNTFLREPPKNLRIFAPSWSPDATVFMEWPFE